MAAATFNFGGTQKTGEFYDGDFTVAKAISTPTKEFPFQNRGDSDTFILRQTYRQFAANFASLSRGKTHPVFTSALLVEETRQEHIGGGIVTWDRVYATKPKERKEPESFIYSYQLVLSDGSLVTEQFVTNSIVTYTYFAAGEEGGTPLLQAPKLIKVGSNFFKVGEGNLYLSGSFVCSHDAMILAESDSYGDWLGEFRYRKRREIVGPNPQFWGSAFHL